MEVGGGNGIRGRAKRLRSFHCWRGGKPWRGHDKARAAKQTDTGRGRVMRISGLLYWRILAAVGTPKGVHSALSGTGEQQEQRDDPSHVIHYAPKDGLDGFWAVPRNAFQGAATKLSLICSEWTEPSSVGSGSPRNGHSKESRRNGGDILPWALVLAVEQSFQVPL